MSNGTLGRRIGKLRGEARRREVEQVIARWREWDGTQSAFCVSMGISIQSLIRWRKAVEDAPAQGAPFVEIGVTSAPSSSCYEIVLASGASVRVPTGFDDGEVSRLLTLASAAC